MHRRPAALLAALALAAGLAGCAVEEPAPAPAPSASRTAEGQLPAEVAALLGTYDVAASDVRSAITELDRVDRTRPLEVQASVRVDEVIFTGASGEVSVPIPGEEMYVSIAPYVEQTHECFYHALGGCQGELVGEDVHVTITAEDGTVLVDEDATTQANGFVGYWLPKDTRGTITITRDGLSGEVPLDTSDEGATCVTTLQLA